MSSPLPVAPRRRGFQTVAVLAVFLVPFLSHHGESLLRFDLDTRSLLVFGTRLRIEELYLFLLLVVSVLLLILLATLVFGRVWCGWACPQTVLSDLVEGVLRLAGARVQAGTVEATGLQRGVLHLVSLAVGLAVACNLVWYFISPYTFFPALLTGQLPAPALWVVAGVGLAVYLDLTLVRRAFCRTVCPYGRIQTTLMDRATLTLVLPSEELPRCIDCGACQRACPTGIDVRAGDQVECINCGRCLDACRGVMARRGEPGLISYRFGREGRGPTALINPRTALVALAAVVVGVVLVASAARRPEVSFSVRRSAAPDRVLADGRSIGFFTAVVGNLGGEALDLAVEAVDGSGATLQLRGQGSSVELAPGEHRELALVLEWTEQAGTAGAAGGTKVRFRLLRRDGRVMMERSIRALRRNSGQG